MIKTNNDKKMIEAKIQLRLMSLPDKDEVNILECFAGEGVLWNEVKKRTKKQLKILSIDKNNYKKISLKGDNIRFLKSLDLTKYQIIDLDAWGCPANQLQVLYEKKYKGMVICSFVQSDFHTITKIVQLNYGYTNKMMKEAPMLCRRNGLEQMLFFINTKFKVNKVKIVSYKQKHYFYFIIK